MSETALYRKYRPHDFKDVIGQEHVVTTLKNSIERGSVAHAYVFAGSRGTGKTSVARIFARALGTTGNDTYEIDAASNRGIDDIRAIRDGVNVLPLESKYKVYIVDEAHMLTKEAWNAFLKTLEEPPAHAIFILATTESEKIPDTVLSRCQLFNFKKPTDQSIRDTVITIAKKEKMDLEVSAAELIALLSDGSFRDALGTLQKVIGSLGTSAKKISSEDVSSVTGAPKRAVINALIKALDTKDSAGGLKALASAAEENIDMAVFLMLIMKAVRAILLLRINPSLKAEFEKEYSVEDLAFLESIATKKDSGVTSNAILEFLKAQEGLKVTPIPTLPLELAVMNLTKAG